MKWKLLNIVLALLLQSCLSDQPPEPFRTSPIDPVGRLLHYAEENGDIVNEWNKYPMVSALDVYQNSGKFLLVDLRTPEEFALGHIPEANNISPMNVFDFLELQNLNNYSKIVFISANGQRAAYITMFAHLYGFPNVYFMNFGMAAWHPDFAQTWLDSIQASFDIKWLTNDRFSKNSLGQLPKINFDNSKNLSENIKERIKYLVQVKFDESFLGLNKLVQRFDSITHSFKNTYLVCYGRHASLYTSGSLLSGDPLPGKGHPFSAVFYSAFTDLQTSESLQTLPTDDRDIVFYSYNGQMSAFAAAYLQFLGYNVSSLEFGATRIINPRLRWDLSLKNFAFGYDKIWNLAYIQ